MTSMHHLFKLFVPRLVFVRLTCGGDVMLLCGDVILLCGDVILLCGGGDVILLCSEGDVILVYDDRDVILVFGDFSTKTHYTSFSLLKPAIIPQIMNIKYAKIKFPTEIIEI